MGNIVDFFERHDGHICSKCFTDYAIIDFIEANSVENAICRFCNSKKTVAPLNDVFSFFMEGIRYDWDNPANCLGWNGREGGWQGALVYDGDELINDIYYDCFNNDEAQEYFADYLRQEEFCKDNPYGLSLDEILKYGWEAFSDQVKHKTRYLFNEYREAKSYHSLEDLEPADFLKALAEQLKQFNLEKELPRDSDLFRVRIHKEVEQYTLAKELGTCPDIMCKSSNRMSPAGIGMFYGAIEEETALAETVDLDNVKGKVATVATFKNLRGLKLIDLSEKVIPSLPSVFDEDHRARRDAIVFLRNFVKDLIKPIERDGREHYEYVPTQIVTEFLRYFPIYNEPIDGLLYTSSRDGKIACALFIDNEQCVDIETDDAILKLTQVKRIYLDK